MNCRPAIALAAGYLATSFQVTADSGLTVAVSPDNSKLVAAGSNRAFLRLDPATLEVKERVWNGLAITKMAFSKDGSVLAAADAGMGGMITLFDSKTLERKTDVKNCDVATFGPAADLFAGIEGNRSDPTTLHVYGLSDGVSKMKTPILAKRAVVAVGLNLKGTLAAVLYDGKTDPAEEKKTPDATLKGFERTIAQQKGDGYTSIVEFYEVPSGKKVAEKPLFYNCNGTAEAIILGDKMLVVNYGNQNALIGQDGSVTMFECANSYNYGMGFTADHQLILTGGLANMAVTTTADLVSKEFKVKERLPSWPEYFRGFSGNADGKIFGATDGYRVFSINRNASVILEKPAF